ncbi:MAG: hypothetical protein KDA96_18165, partial [Planctomycetaceae bacterium]|nr:hypothetical protein [Planctomycetaceae bacterium]
VAGETSRSHLGKKKLRAGHAGTSANNGSADSPEESAAIAAQLLERIESYGGNKEPATAFSWLSEKNGLGMPVVTPPKDQSPDGDTCNSCVAFAVVAAVEARMNIMALQKAGEVNLSEGYLFFAGCDFCCGSGWTTQGGLEAAKNGIPTEEAFPYDPKTKQKPGPVQPVVHVDRFGRIPTPQDMKRAIQVKGPVVAEMTLYEDFKFYQSGVYEHVAGAEIGEHAICIVGYDDAESCWLCKNSWGTDWGFDPTDPGGGGFFKIKYGEAGLGTLPHFDFDIHIELSKPEATAVLDRIVQAAKDVPSLLQCLFWIGRGKPHFCAPNHHEIIQIYCGILAAYPEMEERFTMAIAAIGQPADASNANESAVT